MNVHYGLAGMFHKSFDGVLPTETDGVSFKEKLYQKNVIHVRFYKRTI